MPSIALITTYHFNSGNPDAYARLIRGLRSSAKQLGKDDRLVLVANGNGDTVEDPDQVLKDVDSSHPDRIIPVVMQKNRDIAGGLNVGIAASLRLKTDLIGQVQSSVIIGATWLETMRDQAAHQDIAALYGRLVYEDLPDTVWADGHYLMEGRTLDLGHNQPASNPVAPAEHWGFPCLSAAIFPRTIVELVQGKYGDFVTERLCRYGDCTDVALRCARVSRWKFIYVRKALGTKRRPLPQRAAIACSQLLAARRYYADRIKAAEDRLEGTRYARFLVDALHRSAALNSGGYSPTGEPPPKVSNSEDHGWGTPV